MIETVVREGSCVCGAIKLQVRGELPPPDACHCRQCRKHSGHFFVSTDVPKKLVTILGEENLSWYQSPIKSVRRGFCSACGSSLLWDPTERDWIGVAMGAFDEPTDTHIAIHVFVEEKGDYYELDDGIPQMQPKSQ